MRDDELPEAELLLPHARATVSPGALLCRAQAAPMGATGAQQEQRLPLLLPSTSVTMPFLQEEDSGQEPG